MEVLDYLLLPILKRKLLSVTSGVESFVGGYSVWSELCMVCKSGG